MATFARFSLGIGFLSLPLLSTSTRISPPFIPLIPSSIAAHSALRSRHTLFSWTPGDRHVRRREAAAARARPAAVRRQRHRGPHDLTSPLSARVPSFFVLLSLCPRINGAKFCRQEPSIAHSVKVHESTLSCFRGHAGNSGTTKLYPATGLERPVNRRPHRGKWRLRLIPAMRSPQNVRIWSLRMLCVGDASPQDVPFI